MIFDSEFLKTIKKNQLDDDSVETKNAKCPSCHNIITFSQVLTKEVKFNIILPPQDDSGHVIGQCDRCEQKFSIPIINPEYSSFSRGATLIDHILDKESTPNDAEKLANLPILTEVLSHKDDMKQRSCTYDYTGPSLYNCKKCNASLEGLVFENLKNSFDKIFSEFSSYLNWALGHDSGPPFEYMFIRMPFKCICEESCIAFLSKPYEENYDFEEENFSICNIIGAKPLVNTISPGIYSKSTIILWLHKLLARWTVLFDTIYIIVPFVGHQWMKHEQLVDTWLKLIDRADPRKVRLVTRKGQLTAFKKAYKECKGIDYSLLEKLDLASGLLTEMVSDSKFHAKIYGAVSKSGCEIFSGSANLVSGPSKEVMHFTALDDSQTFYNAFINPLNLNLKDEPPALEQRHSLVFDGGENFSTSGFSNIASDIQYRDFMLFDILPKQDFDAI